MIDMPTVGSYGRYHSFNNDAKRNGGTEESSFSKVFGEQDTGETSDVSTGSGAVILDEMLTGSYRADFEIYTLFGRTRSLGILTGRNINIEV